MNTYIAHAHLPDLPFRLQIYMSRGGRHEKRTQRAQFNGRSNAVKLTNFLNDRQSEWVMPEARCEGRCCPLFYLLKPDSLLHTES